MPPRRHRSSASPRISSIPQLVEEQRASVEKLARIEATAAATAAASAAVREATGIEAAATAEAAEALQMRAGEMQTALAAEDAEEAHLEAAARKAAADAKRREVAAAQAAQAAEEEQKMVDAYMLQSPATLKARATAVAEEIKALAKASIESDDLDAQIGVALVKKKFKPKDVVNECVDGQRVPIGPLVEPRVPTNWCRRVPFDIECT